MSDPVEIVTDWLEDLIASHGLVPESFRTRPLVAHEAAEDLRSAFAEAGWRLVCTVDDPDASAVAPLEAWITEEWTS